MPVVVPQFHLVGVTTLWRVAVWSAHPGIWQPYDTIRTCPIHHDILAPPEDEPHTYIIIIHDNIMTL